MDFESSRENRSFLREMDRFLQDDHDRRVMDVTRERMARVCDMRERQAFRRSSPGRSGSASPRAPMTGTSRLVRSSGQ